MTISHDLLLQQLNWRYATKRFDPDRKIDPATWQTLEQALVLSPSSYGLQPWRFIVITDPSVQARLPEVSWAQNQPRDCSHMVVFAAAEKLDSNYADDYIQSIVSTRGIRPESLTNFRRMLYAAVEGDETHLDWNSRQIYLALGQLLTAAALLGIDTCPMEGIEPAAYDSILGLEGSGYRTVVGCALGYRHPDDPYALLKKVRFSSSQIVRHV